MKFQPKSEEQIQRERCLPAGVYDFEVADATEKQSRSGKDMIELKLTVFVDEYSVAMRDWIVEGFDWKLRHFCETCGILAQYEAGTITAEDCIGQAGKVQVVVKDSPDYGPQNAVKDYGAGKATKQESSKLAVGKRSAAKQVSKMEDDDIPF